MIISNVIWKFAERILAQVVSLIVSIVLARLLLPNDYGAIAMVMVFIAIANIFVTEGLASALIQKKDADQLDFSSVFWANIILSVLIYFILFCSSGWIAGFYSMPILEPVFDVLGLRIIVAAVNSVQHAYVARHMMFRKYFWATLFGTLLSGVVGIAMAYTGFGVWALVAQYMLNTTVDTIVLFFTVNWYPTLQFNLDRVMRLFLFGWRMLFEGVSNTIVGQIRNLIIGRVYTPSDLAYYTKAQQFPMLIISNICVSIASVLFPAIANEQDDKERVLTMLRKAVRVSSYTIYPLLVGLAATATPFIRLVLTDKWIETVPYMQVYCFLNMPTVGMYLRHQALNGTGRSDVYMNEHIVARLLGFIILFLVYRISVLAIVMSSICTSVIMMGIIAFTSKKYNGYGYREQLIDILPTLTACTIMAVPVYFLQFLGLSSGLTLMLQIVVGAAIYISYSKMARLEEYEICKEYALNALGRAGAIGRAGKKVSRKK